MTARILIVEDNPGNSDLMALLLKGYGHVTLLAANGEEGVVLARRESPDLVICDIHLPKLDGYGVLQQIKSEEALRRTPVIAITALAMVGDREKVLAAGFDGYLAKPINPYTFVGQIEKYLRQDLRSARVAPEPPRAAPPVTVTTVERRGRILVVDDVGANRELIKTTLEPHGYDLVLATSAQHGMARAQESHFDLILCDLHMPDQDGIDFIRLVKGDARLQAIPFIFISAALDDDDCRRGLALGALHCAQRPIQPHALIDTIENCLHPGKKPDMPRILVVDDLFANRDFLRVLLTACGYDVIEAADGAEALEMARAQQPNLVISDVLMPTMDGVEFARRLHADPAIAKIPVMFYCATYRLSEAQAMGRTCGVSTVVAKPAHPQEILDIVARELGHPPIRLQKPKTLPSPQDASANPLTARISAFVTDLNALQQQLQLAVERSRVLLSEDGSLHRISDDVSESFATMQLIGLRLSVLIELGLALSSERNPQKLAELFCRAAQDVMNARYAATWLVAADGSVVHHASCGLVGAVRDELAITALSGTLADVLATAIPRRVESGANDFAALGLPAAHPPIRSIMVIPIKSAAHTYGVLYLAGKLGDQNYNLEDERIASTMATQFTLAYENLALYDEVQQYAEQLQRESLERKQAADRLLESETKFRQLAENLHEVFFLLNRDSSEVLYVSPAYEEIWKRPCASLYTQPHSWMDVIHPGDLPAVVEGNKHRDATGRFDYEYRIVRSENDVRWIRAAVFPIVNGAGEIFRIAGIAEDITVQVQLKQTLLEREAGLHRAQLMTKSAHVITGPDGSFESWSETLPQLIGVDNAQMPPTTRNWLDIVHPSDREKFRNCCIEAGKRGSRMEIGYRALRGDGATVEFQQVMEPLQWQADAQGKWRWFNSIQDVTEQKDQQRRIARLSRISAVLSGINSAIVRIRDRHELFREACRIAVTDGAFGMAWIGEIDPVTLEGRVVAWSGSEEGYVDKIRLTARDGLPNSDRPACVAAREQRAVVCNDIRTEPSLATLRDDLLQRGHLCVAALPLILDNRAAAVIALFGNEVDMFDEAELKLVGELAGDLSFGMRFIATEQQLNYQAYYDVLTGLPNIRLFHDRLTQILHSATQEGRIAAVIKFDLDDFSQLNDTLGRHAGDAVLRQVAQRLQASLVEPYTVARVAGDTFAIAIGGMQHAMDVAAILEQQVLAVFNADFVVDQQDIRVTVRAGLALFPTDGGDAETLFNHAKVALKNAKSTREPYAYFAPRMNTAVAIRMSLEKELRAALSAKQFAVYYQPRVDLLSGRIVSAEALIRWQHPQRGLVSPVEFVPLAEENGLIVPMGAWVLDTVCAQQVAWLEQQVNLVPVAVNLSAVQLKKGQVLQTIRDTIAKHSLEKRYIEFELTESMIMDDPEEAARNLQALKDIGVQLALDDFGTGYSSLAYLKRFPFDVVKIDRAFVTDITRSPEDAAIANAVIAMAHSLSLRVVAEGVETEGQLRYLRKHRCDEMQGYFFSPPVPATEFEAMLRAEKRLLLERESDGRADTLLIVDDDPNNLSALRRMLRSEGYHVLVATSGQEGLELLALNAVQVIVADQRMPGMSGAEFLGIVKELYPDTMRIILSGYTDLAAVTDSINRGAVFRFLTKPWDDTDLREQIRDAFRRYRPPG